MSDCSLYTRKKAKELVKSRGTGRRSGPSAVRIAYCRDVILSDYSFKDPSGGIHWTPGGNTKRRPTLASPNTLERSSCRLQPSNIFPLDDWYSTAFYATRHHDRPLKRKKKTSGSKASPCTMIQQLSRVLCTATSSADKIFMSCDGSLILGGAILADLDQVRKQERGI